MGPMQGQKRSETRTLFYSWRVQKVKIFTHYADQETIFIDDLDVDDYS